MSGPPQEGVDFGNLEANRRFLNKTGLLKPGLRVLEIGCGRGTLLAELQARKMQVVGLETTVERIIEAGIQHPTLEVQHTTGATLPFQYETFDLVLSFDVLEHIPDTAAHVEEVYRVLKPGGWYLLQTPNKWTNTIFETIRWRSFTAWKEDHCSLHTYGQLKRRLLFHGFKPTFVDVPVVTAFFRSKVRFQLGKFGSLLLALVNPDRMPLRLRTNFYVRAQKQ